MAILVFQHSDIGGPGRLGMTLRDHGHKLHIVRPDKGEAVPPDLDNVDGVIALGGPQNVDENLGSGGAKWPWMAKEMTLLKQAHERHLPIVGICLGHQMLGAALGGEIAPMARGEYGFHTVTLSPAGHTDPILAGVRWSMPAFQTHGREVVKGPPGAQILASSKACKVQAFRIGLRSYGFQWHFEADRSGVDAFLKNAAAGLAESGMSPDQAAKQADEQYAEFARLSDRICVNIASLLTPTMWRETARRDMPDGPAAITAVR